ncbi:MAG: YbaK/EbsC family protein [bacterium]|nr:YbaK/EbsC family protein [bacterium]MDT8365567.1 YbaK/EbsC family protein [bacterium]
MPRGEKKVVESLLTAGHEPAVRRFDRKTETAEDSAMMLGVEVARIVKSMVFSAQDEPVVALIPGNRRADMRAIARVLEVKKVRMADPDMVQKWTGFTVGAVPPIGHFQKIPVLMDEGFPRDGKIYPAAGENNNAFETTFEMLQEITRAKVCRISKE